jgi:cystathionine beta-lyase
MRQAGEVTEIYAEPIDRLRERTSEKWRAFPDDVLPLFVAEMDYPLAEPIADALIAAVRRSDTGYVAPDAALPAAFASFALRRWGWKVDHHRVLTTTDVSVAIVESLRLAIEPGDGVVIMPPVYPPFFELVPEAGGTVVEVPLTDDGASWSIDLDGVEQALHAGARAVLLCNPHNPLGLVHSAASLSALADLADRYSATVVSDEIHAALTQPDVRFIPFLSVSDAAREHGVTVTSASKSWNLAGLKCAIFVAASDRMSGLLDRLPDEVHVRTALFGRIANTAAFDHGEDWLDSVLRRIRENRELLGALLAQHLPDVSYRKPDASYLAWLDFSALGWGDDPSETVLREARVALNSGPAFGAPGKGFVRLNLGCSAEVLTEAIERTARIGVASASR